MEVLQNALIVARDIYPSPERGYYRPASRDRAPPRRRVAKRATWRTAGSPRQQPPDTVRPSSSAEPRLLRVERPARPDAKRKDARNPSHFVARRREPSTRRAPQIRRSEVRTMSHTVILLIPGGLTQEATRRPFRKDGGCPYPKLRSCASWRSESKRCARRGAGLKSSLPNGQPYNAAIWAT